MDKYPDPDEEYELMYADELEIMREGEQETVNGVQKKAANAKRSLDFSSPVATKTPIKQISILDEHPINTQDLPLTNSLKPVEEHLLTPTETNKRTIEEIFGDIEDLEANTELPSKRQKTEEEVDMELIHRILEEKKIRQMLAEPTPRAQGQGQVGYNPEENLSLDIPRWDFIPLTNSSGYRIYVRLQSEESWEKNLDETTPAQGLHTSNAQMWEEASKILNKKIEDRAQQSQQMEILPEVDTSSGDAALWVERYKPLSYVELLSEEPINRAVLHWLHLWDKVVFKKEVKLIQPQERNSFSKRTGQFQLTNKWKGMATELEPEIDPDGRPRFKVALLCGPPGVGKTTLAHLLAKLAGYRPVELNASDERSVEAFQTALQNATLMQSVLHSDRRPNCLILDEIDGAPLPTVELLVKWCTASTGSGADKKKGKARPLRRPVIAICNDLYAPALRPLRPVSLVVRVEGVSARRLAGRLRGVCAREGVLAAPHVLWALATRAGGDVRAALAVLQFIKARAKAQVKMEDVTSASVGEKDCNKSLQQALQAVFTVNDKPDPLGSVLKTVAASGEYNRLVEGIFENYILARVDARFHIAGATLDWLCLYDIVNTWILTNQNYSLYALLPLCIARCHKVLASRNCGRIKFPMQAQEISRKSAEMQGIREALYRGISPTVAPSTRRALHLDVLSLLPYVLAPTLRSGNIQLCSENERKALCSAAAAMCDYGVEYSQQRGADGLYTFVLEPDIYKLAFFGTEERLRVPPSVRQALSREQQLEHIRRLEAQTAKVKPTDERQRAPVPPQRDVAVKLGDKEVHLPNHLQRLQAKEVKAIVPQVHRDFFGRVVPMSESMNQSDAVRDMISSSNVFYQYREGFNNAVRRSVRTQDLL